jgi:guanine deaminase
MDTKTPDGDGGEGYDYVEPSAEESIRDTHALIHHIRALDRSSNCLVQPILTPRIALSCSRDLLKHLKKFAASEPTLRIQTHISENKQEVAATLKKFKEADSYAGVYDFYGLLRENTILGHAVHLTKDEVKLIKEKGAGIAHCPSSNFNLNSGIAPVGYFLDMGVKVRLLSLDE